MTTRNAYQGKQTGAECPECGSILTMVTQVDYTDAPENYRAREHKCTECDHVFCSIQVVIPDAKFSRISANYRQRRKDWSHRRYGFHGVRTHRPERVTADRIVVSWKVIAGETKPYDPNACGKGHPRTEESTVWRKDGKRECRVCKSEYGRARRARARAERARQGEAA